MSTQAPKSSVDWLKALTNDYVNELHPYESARRLFSANEGSERVWLNANEAPEADTYAVDSALLNRYPDCQPEALVAAYQDYTSDFFGETQSEVLITRGADEGIELLIRAFCEPQKDAILICPPTYGMYKISADTFGVATRSVPLLHSQSKKGSDFKLDTAGIISQIIAQESTQAPTQESTQAPTQELNTQSKVKVIFLCSPNNPTGTLIDEQDLLTVLEASRQKCIVVVDEAYIEFSANTSKQHLLAQYSHLVILRTMSKAYALASIRCGFVLSSKAIKTVLLKVIAPYPVPGPVAQIATQALSQSKRPVMQTRVDLLAKELNTITSTLSTIPQLEIIGQQCGNFVLFRHARNSELMQYLVSNNMLIRDQSKQFMLDKCLRITVGTAEQNKKLLTLIEGFFKQIDNQNEAAI